MLSWLSHKADRFYVHKSSQPSDDLSLKRLAASPNTGLRSIY